MTDRSILFNLASADSLGTVRIATGLNRPLFLTAAPDDSSRLFVLEKNTGRIQIVDPVTGAIDPTPLLEVGADLGGGGEGGLLGLAFHPDYATNGLFFVNFTDTDGDTVVRRYQVSADPNVADPASAVTVMTFEQPRPNHNGGWLGFGPDGYLYIASGDGGGGNDPDNNAQDLTTPLGAMLRIDVDSDGFPADDQRSYAIPVDNPFVGVTVDGTPAFEEIWSYGLRNPWRASFDRETGDLYIGDVGQGSREEVNFQAAASSGGENYGWRLREGDIETPGVGGPRPADNVDPIYDYTRGDVGFEGRSVTGGYVYRGPVSELQGAYVFGDFASDRIWSFEAAGAGVANLTDLTTTFVPDQGGIRGISSFGEDAVGNLYVVDFFDGEIFRVVGPTAADGAVIGEVGQVTGVTHQAQTVTLSTSFQNPVVLALPTTLNGGQPVTVRLSEVQADRFTVRLQEPNHLDGAHVAEDLSFLVIEAGTWMLADGTLLEAGTLSSGRLTPQGFEQVTFDAGFTETPAVLSQVQSTNGSDFVDTRQRAADADGFRLAMEEEEALNGGRHAAETLGWLAIERGQGTWSGHAVEAGTTGDAVTQAAQDIAFAQSFAAAPQLLASVASFDGGDPVVLRARDLDADGVRLSLQEDQSRDAETAHVTEQVDFLALEGTGMLGGNAVAAGAAADDWLLG